MMILALSAAARATSTLVPAGERLCRVLVIDNDTKAHGTQTDNRCRQAHTHIYTYTDTYTQTQKWYGQADTQPRAGGQKWGHRHQTESAEAVGIRGRHVQQGHVQREVAGAEESWDLRQKHRDVVVLARLEQWPHVAAQEEGGHAERLAELGVQVRHLRVRAVLPGKSVLF